MAWLLAIVEPVIERLPLFEMPPPRLASVPLPTTLPLTLQSTSSAVPRLSRPPPSYVDLAAGDGQVVERRAGAIVDLEHAAGAAAADGHTSIRAFDRRRV